MIRLIYQSVSNKKNQFFLLVVQFTIGFSALLFGLGCVFNIMEYKKTIESLSPLDAVHAYIDEDNYLFDNEKGLESKYIRVFERLKKEGLVKKIGIFETMYVYDDISSQELKNESRLYVLNDDSLAMSNLHLNKGSLEPLLNYKSSMDYVPVIVSASFKTKYKVGQTYLLYYMDAQKNEYTKKKIKVVGMLDSSTRFWSGGATYISENITNNKKFILAPQFKPFELPMSYAYNSLFQLPENKKNKDGLIEISSVFKSSGLNAKYSLLKDEINAYNERRKIVTISTTVFASILLLLALLGSIGAILASISTRYKDFGIFYSIGFTKMNIIRLVIGEVVSVFLISFILSVLILKLLLSTLLIDEALTINFFVIFISFAIMITCIVISAIVPFVKLKNIEPIELIKGANG
ncbi:FtsX-like permease family protein [Paenibacillaceae bacterium GAS479]|nr:FtsX-like permease family protein [Paenibacillaceae bacterium GAS479]